MTDFPYDSIRAANTESLMHEIHYLRRICRVASAILSEDDSFEQVRKRFDGELKAEYRKAKADYFQFTGRSAP